MDLISNIKNMNKTVLITGATSGIGLMFWGTPKFVLNNGVEVSSSGKNSGVGSVLSWLKAWPNLEIRVAYKIF